MESSDPVVTRWDDDPPERDVRPVGSLDVLPTNDRVEAARSGRVAGAIPESVKARLISQAERTGETASMLTTMRYDHDIDARSTDTSRPQPDTMELARIARARQTHPSCHSRQGR